MRSLVLAAGARALADLIDGIGRGRREEPLLCCGTKMESTGRGAPICPLKTIPVMYVSYDGTGVPMVKAANQRT